MSLIHAAQPGSARTPGPLAAAPVSPLGRLGSWSYRHRRLVVVAWVLVLVLVSVAGRLTGSQFKDNLNGGTSTPSQQAAAFLQRDFPSQAGDVVQVVFRTSGPVTSAAARDRITTTLAGLARLPRVASPILLLNDISAAEAPARLATLPFIEHDLVTFDYIELEDTSPA